MEWIKFSEKLPENDISVLVFDNGSYHIAYRYGDRMYDEEGCSLNIGVRLHRQKRID